MVVDPARYAIIKFGGVNKLARIIGADGAKVCRWKKNGLIPAPWQLKVIKQAKIIGIKLDAREVVYGGKVNEKWVRENMGWVL